MMARWASSPRRPSGPPARAGAPAERAVPERFRSLERYAAALSDEARRGVAEILWAHARRLRSPATLAAGPANDEAIELLEALARAVEP
jgi:hypothetical protein